MQLSYNGLEALKEHEGFRDKAYLDTGGVWTIGYGTTKCSGVPVEAGQTCTNQEACIYCAMRYYKTQGSLIANVSPSLTTKGSHYVYPCHADRFATRIDGL